MKAQSDQRFRTVADTAPIILVITELTGSATYLSRGWYEFTGQPVMESPKFVWMKSIHAEQRSAVKDMFRSKNPDGNTRCIDLRLRRKDGEYRWVSATATARRDAKNNLVGYNSSLIDIAERKLAEEMLQRVNDNLKSRMAERTMELRTLALELLRTEQRERNHLARYLHDDVQQLLVAIKMRAEMACSQETDSGRILEVIHLADEAIRSCRSLVVGLSPPVLRAGDFAAAMEWLARHMSEQHSLHVEFTVETTPVLTEDCRWLFFQIARELLFNVVKHANIRSASLRIGRTNHDVWLEVADKGKGCHPTILLQPRSDGFGLSSIQERLAGLGGAFDAHGEPGKGCRMRVSVPLAQANQASVAV